jgi:hypothetical protein
MMTMAHAAAGAAIARSQRSKLRGVVAAFGAHALLDMPRHEDLGRRAETALTLATIGITARLFGVRSREFWGAFACASPDLEHLLPQPAGGPVFPTHRWKRLHNAIPTPLATAPAQLVMAGATLAVLHATRRRRARA